VTQHGDRDARTRDEAVGRAGGGPVDLHLPADDGDARDVDRAGGDPCLDGVWPRVEEGGRVREVGGDGGIEGFEVRAAGVGAAIGTSVLAAVVMARRVAAVGAHRAVALRGRGAMTAASQGEEEETAEEAECSAVSPYVSP
jgi:hypothetical protein